MKLIAKFLPVLALFFLFPAASSESLSGAGGALYSEWSATPAAAEVSPVPVPVRYGSFTVSRPQSELFIGGLAARWRAELSGLASAEQFEEFALRRFRDEIASDGGSADIGDWLAARGEASRDHLLTGSADYLTSYLRGWLTGLAERSAGGLPFVRNVEWDYQSALGERRWSTGLSALGALREGSDDAVVWQMRAFAAEESSKGANAGLIYRRVAGGGLIGVNTFLDYESNGDYDEAFWRGSLGGEYRSAIVNVYLNRYFGITDGVQRDGGWIYTRDGTDAELDIQVPDFPLGGFSGGVTYYRWEGEYGDEDDKGFRYHLQLQPAGLGARLRLRLELDSPDVGSTDWGGAVSYSYLFGAPAPAAAVAASGFDPRAHFFDPARREYSQRIVRSRCLGPLIRSQIVVVGGQVGGSGGRDNVWSSTGACESLTLAGADSFPISVWGAALAELGGALYLSGGVGDNNVILNTVWRSADGGANWVEAGTFANDGRALHSMVSYNDKLYIIGGFQSAPDSSDIVLSSSDGVDWEPAGTITGGSTRAAIVHNNTLFIIGGQRGNSPPTAFKDSFAIDEDGTISTLVVSNNLPAYLYAAAVSFKGTIYRIGGGESINEPQNDIWSSVDGANWTRLMKKGSDNQDVPANFPVGINAHQVLVYGEGIYVLGGFDRLPDSDSGRVSNRVWYSTNVTDWVELSNMPGRRWRHAATVLPTPSSP